MLSFKWKGITMNFLLKFQEQQKAKLTLKNVFSLPPETSGNIWRIKSYISKRAEKKYACVILITV